MSEIAETLSLTAHHAQLDFINERERTYVGFRGGRGAGKSYAGALRLLKWSLAEPAPYGMYANTYPVLMDTILATFLEVASPFIREFSESKKTILMKTGFPIRCRSLDDPENARGPSLRGAIWDEASLVKTRKAFDILIGCLRWHGLQGWLAATFTPKGPQHWSTEAFIDSEDATCFQASTYDNPFNPPGFADRLRRQYTTAYAEQEIYGGIVSLAGKLFKREWFKILDTTPGLADIRRYWDLAATVPEEGKDPDWTAGALVGRTRDGKIIIVDIRHEQLSPAANEMLIQSTAQQDGKRVRIGMEQEGGASGKSLVDHYKRNILNGYRFEGFHPTGDKVVRATPWAGMAEAGNVYLVRGPWNKAFLDEVEQMGYDAQHDDQIDAVSGAVGQLLASPKISPHVGSSEDAMFVELSSSKQDVFDAYKDILAQAKTPEERTELIAYIRENTGMITT